jgi:UDP-GlcNAc:undecaprenyl-phosphate GlcNAc-1-phosphate transferase
MLHLLWIFAAGFCCCLVLTPLARALGGRYGILDRPDGRRKTQTNPIPRTGGLAVLGSALLVLTVVAVVTPFGDLLRERQSQLLGIALGSLCIAAVGVADDLGRLRGRHKLLGQCAAVAVVLYGGVTVRTIHLFGHGVELGMLAIPFTAFFLLGAINSLNLIDGMDGLLSSVAVTICLAMAAMAAGAGHWATSAVAIALAGALLGFLRYNFPPAMSTWATAAAWSSGWCSVRWPSSPRSRRRPPLP